MAFYARRGDAARILSRHSERIRRQATKVPAETLENFIMDPITVRAWPAAVPARSQLITGYAVNIGSGSADVSFWVLRETPITGIPNPLEIASGSFSTGLAKARLGTPCDLEPGDLYYPEITDGSGTDITASFIVTAD